jgi:hypothetical protein
MMRRLLSISAGGVLLTTTVIAIAAEHANGYFKTGNEIKTMLEARSPLDNIEALGYVTGVADGVMQVGLVCAPPQVTTGQIQAVALKYMRDNPDILHMPSYGIIGRALIDTWPCKRK